MTVTEIGKFPDFYCCYLLKSVPKPRSYYIGSTPNPIRRLRQHNGDLKAGGAYRTKKQGFRPWKMIAIVYGFPSKISALQFEHAWQHPFQTRHIPVDLRIAKSRSSCASIDQKIGNLKLLLRSDGFVNMNLRVELFSPEAYTVWHKDKYKVKLPDHLFIRYELIEETEPEIIQSGNYNQVKMCMDKENEREEKYLQNSLKIWQERKQKSNNLINCDICSFEISSDDHKAVCIHTPCDSVTHIECLVEKMIALPQCERMGDPEIGTNSDSDDANRDATDTQTKKKKGKDKKAKGKSKTSISTRKAQTNSTVEPLIPISGKCPKCSKVNVWINIVKNSSKLNKELKNIGETG